ncbi:MAG TPA: tetratricopeptide repeat protein [Phycisphaerales bacterium]|nr:tetratricopeptide repeat protein [Phycisphaerales bacterium]
MAGLTLHNVLLHAQSLTDSGRVPHAITFLQQHRKSFALDPNFNALLGTLLGAVHDYTSAAGCLELAWRGGAQRADVLLNLAVCLASAGKRDRAEKLLRDGIKQFPDHAIFRSELITVLRQAGRVRDAACESVAQWRANPADASLARRVCSELLMSGDVEPLIAVTRDMRQQVHIALEAQCNMMLQLLYSDAISREQLFEEHKRAALLLRRRVPSLPDAFTNSRDPDRKLRIAYCSQDFRNRSAGHFIEGIIASHDRERFEVYCYHHAISEDELTQRLKSRAHAWRDINGVDDYAVARLARADGIDIWIDLTGWTGAGRIGICAVRAAPVQATYMGYASTTGLDTINVRFVDAITDPPTDADAFATERLLRIAPCFLAYTPPHHLPAVAPGPALRDASKPITFGSFNTYQKITPTCLDHWCTVLRELPQSRMLIKNSHMQHAQCRDTLLAAFSQRGIGAARIELRPETPGKDAHLATYRDIDIALDTYPYHGTTTTIEALMMGVPVITRVGATHHARVGASLLQAINQPDWITTDAAQFAAAAKHLASDRAALQTLRNTLRSRVTASPLCDTRTLAAHMETHCRALWREWCQRI